MSKKERFGLVLSKSEKDMLKCLAEKEGGLSQAALLRRLIYKAVREYDLQTSQAVQITEVAKTNDR